MVEDHALLVTSLVRILRERGGYEVPVVADTAEKALEYLPGLRVDLALVDVSLPRMSGIDLVKIICSKYPDLPCLMLSGHASAQYVDRSLEAGARGYILKDDVGGIIEGIKKVLRGEKYISKQLVER
jgi:DNA-binding NarL/FixJ family response regulator